MPKVSFRWTDGSEYPINKTLEGDIPLEYFDQYPMVYYQEAAEDREWMGRPSASRISGGGPRQAFLEYVTPFAVDLNGFAFALAGTKTHANVESAAEIAELPVSTAEVSGRLDLLEHRPNGELWLIDWKNVGSYAYRLFKGIYTIDVPQSDEFGTPIFYKTGKKKGEMKTKKEYRSDPARSDNKKYLRQLNIYRYLLETNLQTGIPGMEGLTGKNIDKLKVAFHIRDGGIQAASRNGVEGNFFLEDVPIVSDEKVLKFIRGRGGQIADSVSAYLEKYSPLDPNILSLREFAPELCNAEDAWEGRRCKDYCPVSKWCQAIGDNHWLNSIDPSLPSDTPDEGGTSE